MMSRRRRAALVVGGLALAFVLWEVLGGFVAYTDDAFVRSDLIAVAPEVTGRVIAVAVHDNQTVRQGDDLATIDPVPFELALAEREAEVREARAQVDNDPGLISAGQDRFTAASSAATFARDSQRRLAELGRTGDVSREALDRADDALRRAEADLAVSAVAIATAQAAAEMHQAALARAEAARDTARWQLGRTHLTAPADGTVNNLTLRAGDTATANVPLIGIVDAHAWRIIANYKQDRLRGFRPGMTAWVWLDSQPWRLHRARIDSIARGISRNEAADKLLPYVAPTTDWIRLQRRFPVTITLVDPPPGLVLFMGADARTLVFP